MANIQRGDERQYLSHGVADADFSGQAANIIESAANTGISITQKANESNLANNQIDLSNNFLAKNNEINLKYQADPTNPERERELQQAFEYLSSQYKINPLCQKQWNEIKTDVFNRYKTYNTQWVEKQQQSNIQSNLKNGYENLTNQVSMLGLNGAGVDEIRLIYANGIEGLRNGATAGLGEMVVNDFLKDSNHDIMATYLSALALNNPLEAQKLLQDKGVRDDIGRAETLEKLENYVSSSLVNQNKRTAVAELGNTLRSMNSTEAANILNGKADLNKVMKFIESNKKLPEGSKDLILDIYGIGSKSEYFYDRDKQKIVKQPEHTGHSRGRNSSSGTLTSLKNLSKMQKIELADNLEMALTDMFSFADTEKVNPKKVVKNKTSVGINSSVLGRLQSVAEAQGALDTAYNSGIIDKAKRQKLINNYIQPMTDYLEANLAELDERKGFFGTKLGYANIKKAFDVENAGRQKNAVRKNLLTAQTYYYSSLEKARQQRGLQSIYDIENLPSTEQQQIYKIASDSAIANAKRYGEHPELFFKDEYPQFYSQGVSLFGIKDGTTVAKKVAKEIYNAPEGQKIDVSKAMSDAIVNMKSYKKQQATDLIHAVIATNKSHNGNKIYGDNRVLSEYEIETRAKTLGLTKKQLTNDAYSKRVSPQMYLIYLESLKRNKR